MGTSAKPKVYIAYTGGTIGMQKTGNGYAPAPGYLEKRMRSIPAFSEAPVPDWDLHQYDPLLDSSNMEPKDWVAIAADLRSKRDEYDGFLVVHGTDTMAYTASALSFLLLGFDKPVIVTGSQIPFAETRNDAQENLLTSLIILGQFSNTLKEVCLYFDNVLLRGNRSTKVNADGFAAFASPNHPPLSTIGINVSVGDSALSMNIDLDERRLLSSARAATPLFDLDGSVITVLKLFPGLRAEQIEHLLLPSAGAPVDGVVMECFGAGNAPSKNVDFMAALTKATGVDGSGNDVVIVDVTQPLVGSADLDLYATGTALKQAGVTSGYDMTTEAALTKLFFLFAAGLTPTQVRLFMEQPLAGELTRPGDDAATIDLVSQFAEAAKP